MELIERKESSSVRKVFELLFAEKIQEDTIKKIINDPYLAESCRKDLSKRWKMIPDI